MSGQPVLVEMDESEYTFIIDTQGLLTQLVPASSLGLYNDTTLLGHDKGWEVAVTQSDGTTPFPIGGLTIRFYAKLAQTSMDTIWLKTSIANAADVYSPAVGLIDVWARSANTVGLELGQTIFLYTDILDPLGGPINVGKWTTTISQ